MRDDDDEDDRSIHYTEEEGFVIIIILELFKGQASDSATEVSEECGHPSIHRSSVATLQSSIPHPLVCPVELSCPPASECSLERE